MLYFPWILYYKLPLNRFKITTEGKSLNEMEIYYNVLIQFSLKCQLKALPLKNSPRPLKYSGKKLACVTLILLVDHHIAFPRAYKTQKNKMPNSVRGLVDKTRSCVREFCPLYLCQAVLTRCTSKVLQNKAASTQKG